MHSPRQTYFSTVTISKLDFFPKRDGRSQNAGVGSQCRDSDWQLPALAQDFSTPSPHFCTLERLDIFDSDYSPPRWQDDTVTEDAQWLELSHPFTSMKDLYLSEEVSRRVAPALKKLVGERVTEVLPVLKSIFVSASGLRRGRVQKALGRFAAARQLSSHSVAVQHY